MNIESWDRMETTPVDSWFSDEPRVAELIHSIQHWTLAALRGCNAAELARRVLARHPESQLYAVHFHHRSAEEIRGGWQRVGVTVGGFIKPEDGSSDEAMRTVSRMLEEAVFLLAP